MTAVALATAADVSNLLTDLTAQLDRLSQDRTELARLSAAALAHAPELTWDAAVPQLVAAYESAVSVSASLAGSSDALIR